MLADRIEAKWIDAFCEIFERCAVKPGDTAAILSETQSRVLNVHLAELALLRMGAKPFHVIVPTPRNRQIVIDSQRMWHAAWHPGPEPRYALIVSFESGDALKNWIESQKL